MSYDIQKLEALRVAARSGPVDERGWPTEKPLAYIYEQEREYFYAMDDALPAILEDLKKLAEARESGILVWAAEGAELQLALFAEHINDPDIIPPSDNRWSEMAASLRELSVPPA